MRNSRIFFFSGVLLILAAFIVMNDWQPTYAQSDEEMDTGAAIYAVDLIGVWVETGAPEMEAFDYVGQEEGTYQGIFEVDILPLFTQSNIWASNSMACSSCHFANNPESYHEMGLSNYQWNLTRLLKFRNS